LTRSEQWQLTRLLFVILVMAILEVVGIASVLPFMQIAANPEQLLDCIRHIGIGVNYNF